MEAFDFDRWKALAETDPEGFVRERRAAIDRLIAATPEHEAMLRQVQSNIDTLRATAATPQAALSTLGKAMFRSLESMRAGLEQIKAEAELLRALEAAAARRAPPATH